MRSVFLFAFLIILSVAANAQDTAIVIQKAGRDITARYHVLKNKTDVKVGLYQLLSKKNMAIASGRYDNNKRVGIWRFFNNTGQLMQIYNYTTDSLTYESPEGRSKTFYYVFDKEFVKTDLITKPVRIGGRYLGYLPYLNLFEKPAELAQAPNSDVRVTIELLISPYGRLADFAYHISAGSDYTQDLNVNLNIMKDEDKIFIPGSVNGEPVSTRIIIQCTVKDRHTLELVAPI